jgi:hypothetical protein
MIQRAMRASVRRHGALWIAIVIVCAWMIHPILTPAHVEGFSASIVSLALHLNAGELTDYDRLHPANLEYFTLSRLGTLVFVSALTGPLGLSGEWAIRLTTWFGFTALVISSWLLARRWTNASGLAVVLALLLIPGVAESAFFYNDTIFAAALGTSALAVICLAPGFAATVIGGVLFGAAVVARLDAVLLVPAIVLIAYEQHGLARAFWLRALIFAIAVLVPVVLVPSAFHASILDVVAATRHAIGLWGIAVRPAQHARELSFFLGFPAAVLVALGSLGLIRGRDHRRLLLLVGVPVLFNLVAFGKIWQSRQLLPMTPFLASLLVLGWRHVISVPHGHDRRNPLEWTVIAVCSLTWLAPIVVVRVSDGPRAPYGRLWSPILWRRWQSAVSSNQVEIRALVVESRRDSIAIVTDTWDGDRYAHLALQETGYRIVAPDVTVGSCDSTAELFAQGGRKILHIRLHQPFLPNRARLAAARLQTWGVPCIVGWRPQRIVLLSPLEQLRWSMSDSVPVELRPIATRALATIRGAGYSPQLTVELQLADLASLRLGYLRQAQQEGPASANRQAPADALQAAERLMAARIWESPPGTP